MAQSTAKSRDADSEFHFDETWKPRFNPWVIAFTVTLATFMEARFPGLVKMEFTVGIPRFRG